MSEENNKKKKGRRVDLICALLLAVVLGGIALLNLIQPNRPTVSESEKRNLSEMPSFSLSSLLSGEYFSDLSLFLSDTFISRESLVDLSKKMELLQGIDYQVDGKDFVIIGDGDFQNDNDDDDDWDDDDWDDDDDDDEDPTADTDAETKEKRQPTEEEIREMREKEEAEKEHQEYLKKLAEEEKQRKLDELEESVNNDIEFFRNGLFIYGDGVYIPPTLNAKKAKLYLEAVKKFEDCFGYDISLTVLPIPTSSMQLDGSSVSKAFTSGKTIQNRVVNNADPIINVVNVYDEMIQHKDEYLYFKTDHHWTSLGAYYAYVAFAKSKGFTPTPLEQFSKYTINENWNGSLYSYTRDDRVKGFSDVIIANLPTKTHTITISNSYGVNTYKSCIFKNRTTYLCFIGGDNPYTEITVPSNPQDRTILVFKDSFGDAFVPYLCEHYGKIYVIDPRHFTGDLWKTFQDFRLTDILFANSITMINSKKWINYYNDYADNMMG